jgi:N-acetylneuraminate synthase
MSDHSGTIHAGLAAAALGANLLEVHVTMSHGMFGPDVAASVTGEELAQLVEGCRMIERSMASATRGVKESRSGYESDGQGAVEGIGGQRTAMPRKRRQDRVSEQQHPRVSRATDDHWHELRWIFGKGLVARQPLTAGHVLRLEDLDARKPANGLPASQLRSVLGRRLACDLAAGERLSEAVLEDVNCTNASPRS